MHNRGRGFIENCSYISSLTPVWTWHAEVEVSVCMCDEVSADVAEFGVTRAGDVIASRGELDLETTGWPGADLVIYSSIKSFERVFLWGAADVVADLA